MGTKKKKTPNLSKDEAACIQAIEDDAAWLVEWRYPQVGGLTQRQVTRLFDTWVQATHSLMLEQKKLIKKIEFYIEEELAK